MDDKILAAIICTLVFSQGVYLFVKAALDDYHKKRTPDAPRNLNRKPAAIAAVIATLLFAAFMVAAVHK